MYAKLRWTMYDKELKDLYLKKSQFIEEQKIISDINKNSKGKVVGLEHFGYSAPYSVLDEKFGYTAENVFNQVLSYLEDYK